MKKLVMVILLMTGLSGFSQEREIRTDNRKEGMLTAEQNATLKSKKMALALDLSDSQQSKVKAIILKNEKARNLRKEAFKIRRQNGNKPTKEELFQRKNEKLDHQLAMKREMKSVLTENQFIKWEDLMQKREKEVHRKKRPHLNR